MKDTLDFKFMKQDVEKEIKEKKLESIHYVLFDENKRLPWAFHLFYKDGKFLINGRDDRSYVLGKTFEFTNFLEAKDKFFKLLDFIVREGRRDVAKRGSYMYPSPLWDDVTE